ncbi:hypothetical protein NHX12_025635 [Muraenolepis orangiensis]|uniref:Uncharacterized protein n=1 Tax=Muraenolepis orangiensis TaxID=630683 RepID=A0A9Q0IPJ1_9TELE|nr:hypothetical protein NHX12_025635 [Muraenolepis orangiensis]
MAVSAMLNRNLSTTFPFLSTIDLDLAGLKRIRAHSTSSSSPFRIPRQPGTDSVMTVRSSMNALMGGCRCPEFVRGPLHSGSADLVSSLHTSLVRRMVDLLILMVPDQDPQDLFLTEVRGLDHLEPDARALVQRL